MVGQVACVCMHSKRASSEIWIAFYLQDLTSDNESQEMQVGAILRGYVDESAGKDDAHMPLDAGGCPDDNGGLEKEGEVADDWSETALFPLAHLSCSP